ncbi:efflux RND transporter periplasmic adaptor subunit [Terriglobus tenax]|uniref:efflux RND transporter periplasmic adaptor subunit n=1 Tax=Terriglobus tenax TaxID=1111115 RepID=UPI0021E0ACD3|nr:efflux RND transporter periplasmic adaptor subunit [Terriglobus tenax]
MMNQRRRVIVIVAVVLLGIAITLVVTGIGSRKQALAALQTRTDESSIEDVSVIIPRRGDSMRTLDLPGDISAWYEAPIYAQVSGYVKMWDKDYGASVHRGEILATINTPKLDAQYRASSAKVDVATAKMDLADLTAKRWKNLEGTQAVSRQQVDVQAANARTQHAETEAAKHDLAQFEALERFRTIVAPFDGIVTARKVNVGDYVSEAGGELGDKGDATELFTVADVHKLRIFVSVPQDYIDILKKGVTATITVPQYPGQVFHAQFLTAAWALDKDSRTVTTELVMDNPGNKVWPGSYADVHFSVPSESAALQIPENALIFQEEGEQIAVVDKSNHVVLKKVTVGRNLGQDVEILEGLSPEDRVINNPSAGMLNGEAVRIVPHATPGYNQVETASTAFNSGEPKATTIPGEGQ